MSSPGKFGSRGTKSVLAIDMTALWNQKTTGIQRVIRETTPFLAAAAAERGWDIVLVKQHVRGLEEIARWSGDFDAARVDRDLNFIAAASPIGKQTDANLVTRLLRNAAQSFRQADIGGWLGLRFLERRLRRLIPPSVRREFHDWRGKHRRLCAAADAYLSFSAGLLPVCPTGFTPPERAVFVIHDLIPLHYSHNYPLEFTQAYSRNISELAFGPFVSQGRFVTASRHIAADIDATRWFGRGSTSMLSRGVMTARRSFLIQTLNFAADSVSRKIPCWLPPSARRILASDSLKFSKLYRG